MDISGRSDQRIWPLIEYIFFVLLIHKPDRGFISLCLYYDSDKVLE